MTHRRAPGHGPELPIVPIKWPPRVLATAVLLAILGALSLFIGVTMASAAEIKQQRRGWCLSGYHQDPITGMCLLDIGPLGVQDGPDPLGIKPLLITDDSDPFLHRGIRGEIGNVVIEITTDTDEGYSTVTIFGIGVLGVCDDALACATWVTDSCRMNGRKVKPGSGSMYLDAKGNGVCEGGCAGDPAMTVKHTCVKKRETASWAPVEGSFDARIQTSIPIEE